jgi:methylenetetrahydrofolate--tRNA-(uracil-5-)-methyltransferase
MAYDVHIIGAGLAGSEAALVAARNGLRVRLSEMRPAATTAVHKSGDAAEIVCSNSLGSLKSSTAGGCLKRELALLDSPLIEIALAERVPAGHALAVDREKFAARVTAGLLDEAGIELVREEIEGVDPRPGTPPTLVATGPLTSDIFLRSLALLLGEDHLYFFDAISLSIENDSIDPDKTFLSSRYEDATGGDYINCPLTKEEYEAFHKALIEAERVEIKDFEPDKLFEGCIPIEVAAARGLDAMRFGPLKPVGLVDPRTGRRPWAVVQLRREQIDTRSWNLVGFQTRLKHGEQVRVFRMIPGLERAEFTRLGSMHRNAYIKSPYLLEPTLQVSEFPHILIAGCLAGVEGYVEDIATGHLAGLALAALVRNREIPVPPELTMCGALLRAITNPKNVPFQPMAVTLGLLPPLSSSVRTKALRREAIVRRSLDSMMGFVEILRSRGFMVSDAIVIPD